MTPEQRALFDRMKVQFPGITQASPPTTSFYNQYGITPDTRLRDVGRVGPRTPMTNFRAAIQGAAQQADDVAAAIADDAARAAAPAATRGLGGLGGLFFRALGSTPFGAAISALYPTRMGDGTRPDELFGRLNPPEAMEQFPVRGMSVPISDSGAMSPAEDLMLGEERIAPSPMGMPGMLEMLELPSSPVASAPPAPSVQSGFGYEGFDSAAVSETPDVRPSIDVLLSRESPEMPAAPAVRDAPARAAAPAVRELAPSMSQFPTPRPEMQGPAMPMYEVQSGDYLGKIAQNVGLPLADLIALNPQIENPDLIFPGQMLNLS
jgi:hypothetical protein